EGRGGAVHEGSRGVAVLRRRAARQRPAPVFARGRTAACVPLRTAAAGERPVSGRLRAAAARREARSSGADGGDGGRGGARAGGCGARGRALRVFPWPAGAGAGVGGGGGGVAAPPGARGL